MRNREIRLRVDGRVFSGTSVEILADMKMLAFGFEQETLRGYMGWLAGQIVQMTGGPPLVLPDGDDAALATFLVDAMVSRGLALETLATN